MELIVKATATLERGIHIPRKRCSNYSA